MAHKSKGLPMVVDEMADEISSMLGVTWYDLFIADHTHEELPAGSWSIAFEGWTGEIEWPQMAVEKLQGKFPGWFLEPLTSWCLGIYKVKE